jgi:threonine dehydrogenase-like Zn-dependent dehydrogenase
LLHEPVDTLEVVQPSRRAAISGPLGEPVPVHAYLPGLLENVLAGRIYPGRVFDLRTDLGGIAEAYAAMDQRRAIQARIEL